MPGYSIAHLDLPETLQLNRTSAVLITYMGQTQFTSGNTSYVRVLVNNSIATPGPIVVSGGTPGIWNTTTATWYNSSVVAGTYTIAIQGNSSAATGNLSFYNNSLTVVAYPT